MSVLELTFPVVVAFHLVSWMPARDWLLPLKDTKYNWISIVDTTFKSLKLCLNSDQK
jgi:hypothetical protein